MKSKKHTAWRREVSSTEALRSLEGAVVVVVGDIMVDRYFLGTVRRISPEAPVPIVDVEGESLRLGGAANVANNIRTLGGRPLLCGVIGDDEEGRWLIDELGRNDMAADGVTVASDMPTTVKTRIMAHHQQVVRYDRERKGGLTDKTTRRIHATLRKSWKEADGLLVSDYAKGVVVPPLMDFIGKLNSGRRGIPVAVDPKGASFAMYGNATVLTPNLAEAQAAAFPRGHAGTVLEAGRKILSRTGAGAVLITRGEEGMTLVERRKRPCHIPTEARNVFDVTGAGDTVIAALTLGIASGLPLRDAAVIANAAAGIVVGELGTVPADRNALKKAFSRSGSTDACQGSP